MTFNDLIQSPPGTRCILQGNAAFALGVVHAGYHAATGYPGTPSTEVIDKSLAFAQDTMKVGWSVNEAVAVSTAVGHAIAGHDAVVTMKIPGVFQAADAITTSAFFSGAAGALVIYAVTDYVPSSTQHVIDPRYFFASARLPVLEPRSHQELYRLPAVAADLSREFHTPVVILASGILAHSEALIVTGEPRTVLPKNLPADVREWMLLPGIARKNYDTATRERIPAVKAWGETSDLIAETPGREDWGVIVNGESDIIVREALSRIGRDPSILSIALSYPLPENTIRSFASRIGGAVFIVEDGDRFLEEKIRLMGVALVGKEDTSVQTNWTPQDVLEFLARHIDIEWSTERSEIPIQPLPRPPSICPGCSYRAFALAVAKLKRIKKIYAAFGDIGCSTLLYFLNALDTVSCMGASDAIRQGFVLSRPDMAGKVISIIGDSTECHSGLDATRNGVFRNVPGVKIILDNYTTAMTGGQPAPSSHANLEGRPHGFTLRRAVEAEGGRTVVVDAFDLDAVERELKDALALAEQNIYSTIILEGDCIHEVERQRLDLRLEIDYEKCVNCDLCNICPGIELDDAKVPHFTSLCTNCASNVQVCVQRCPLDAIVPAFVREQKAPAGRSLEPAPAHASEDSPPGLLPDALRVAIRGIGGQGNLFFGKVLAEVALRTKYAETRIVKGETHGMAQLGGPVISTFSCGDVHSPIPAPQTVDVLVAMEASEILRPDFLGMLKRGGTIIVNSFTALPVQARKEDYPDLRHILESLDGYAVHTIDALRMASEIGDTAGRAANVVVLGLLSTMEPFDRIPWEVWHNALLSLSLSDSVKALNAAAFNKGREYLRTNVEQAMM